MVPFVLTPEQFARRYRSELERHSEAFLAELRRVLAMPVEEGTASASVVVFLDESGQQGPKVVMFFDKKDKKAARSDPAIFPGRHLTLAAYLRDLEPFHPDYYADPSFGALDLQADVTKAWAAEWWWKAGGWSYPLRAYVSVHGHYGGGVNLLLSPGK